LKALTALLIYPVVFFLIKDPAALRYARVHGFSPMPQSVQLPLEENGRLLYFVKFLVVALFLIAWANVHGVNLWAFLGHVEPGQHVGRIALASTVILFSGHISVLYLFKRVRGLFFDQGLSRGHFLTWITIIFVGGVVEESWRALTLSASSEKGFNSLLVLLATSAAAAFCHLLGIPGRTLGLREEVFWDLAVGLALGALFVLYGTVLIPLSVNMLYNVFNLLLIRSNIPREKSRPG